MTSWNIKEEPASPTSRSGAAVVMRHCELVLALIEQRTISAAAGALGLTQSAVTKALRRAETELGVPLFERRPRGVRPTPYGRAVEAHAKLVRRQCEDALAELRTIAGGESGRVSVGAGASFLDSLLPAAIARLAARFPEVTVEITVDPRARQLELLREGSLDVLLVSEPAGIALFTDLVWDPLITNDMGVVARSEHPLAQRGAVPLPALLDHGWVLGGGSDPQQLRLEEIFRSRGLAVPRAAVTTVSRAASIEIVRQSDLLTLLPNARFQAPARGMAFVDCPEVTWRREAGLIRRRGVILPPGAQRLIETVHEICRLHHVEAA